MDFLDYLTSADNDIVNQQQPQIKKSPHIKQIISSDQHREFKSSLKNSDELYEIDEQ